MNKLYMLKTLVNVILVHIHLSFHFSNNMSNTRIFLQSLHLKDISCSKHESLL